MECCGVYEDIFLEIIKQSSYIHMTDYKYGTENWHTHIHHNPEHSLYMLGLLKKADYSGFIVSEASSKHQRYLDFQEFHKFIHVCHKTNTLEKRSL